MHIAPPIDPIPASLKAILDRREIPTDWLNADRTGDPYEPQNIARHELAYCDSNIPWHYRDAVLDRADVIAWADELIGNALDEQGPTTVASVHRGPSLLLLGPTGTGKTYLTYAAMREIAVTGVRCNWRATTAADLYAALRPRAGVDSEAEFRRYANVRLLILDDLGAAKDSEFTEEINYRLINTRYEHGLPTLITSNVPVAQLGAKLGERVASRLVGMCQRVVLRGDDRRRSAA